MQKTTLTLLIPALLLTGCWSEPTPSLTLPQAQDLFDQAFITSQTTPQEKTTATLNDQIHLAVTDNQNDVLPATLEDLTLTLIGSYDFTDPTDLQLSLSTDLFFNSSHTSDLGLSINLDGHKLSGMLTSLSPDAITLLDITDLVGGPEGIDLLKAMYLNKPQTITLNSSEYTELVQTLTTTNPDTLTPNQDLAIANAFTDHQILTITSTQTQTDGSYLFDYELQNTQIAPFLEEVATINNLTREFSDLTDQITDLTLTGQVILSPVPEITKMTGQAFLPRELFSSREDKIIDFTYEQIPNTLTLVLVNPISQETQATLELPLTTLSLLF